MENLQNKLIGINQCLLNNIDIDMKLDILSIFIKSARNYLKKYDNDNSRRYLTELTQRNYEFSGHNKNELDEVLLHSISNIQKLCFGSSYIIQKEVEIDAKKIDEKLLYNVALPILKDTGICIITNFASEEEVSKINSEIDNVENFYTKYLGKKENIEDEKTYYRGDPSTSILKIYQDYVLYDKTVIMPRLAAYDFGVVDIFNIDFLCEYVTQYANEKLRSKNIEKLISEAFLQEFKSTSLHAYINDNRQGTSAFSTRDFHFDGTIQAKSFLYLSDVLSLEHGPYTFIPKSHKKSLIHQINQEVNLKYGKAKGFANTDLKAIIRDGAIPCFGKAGTLIITSQAGAHRGITQAPTYYRRLITQAYFLENHPASPFRKR